MSLSTTVLLAPLVLAAGGIVLAVGGVWLLARPKDRP
jgi:hypothetical protein